MGDNLGDILTKLSPEHFQQLIERYSLQQNYAKNQQYAKQADSYQSQLSPEQEQAFQAWLAQNKIPFDASNKLQDYDMRGFWLALQNGEPRAASAVDPNDGKIHYPDYWKTPYHSTFSNESQYALPNAPKWNRQDQLTNSSAQVIFDDKKASTQKVSK